MKNLLGGAVDRAGIQSQLFSTQVVQEANTFLLQCLPASRKDDARAVSFRNHILSIHVLNSAASQFLGQHKEDLRSQLMNSIPSLTIDSILIRVVNHFETDV